MGRNSGRAGDELPNGRRELHDALGPLAEVTRVPERDAVEKLEGAATARALAALASAAVHASEHRPVQWESSWRRASFWWHSAP
jgi:hypothetical protein